MTGTNLSARLFFFFGRQDVSPVRVIPWARNMQSHALTCSVANGSLGQHFRTLSERVDVEEVGETP